MDRKINDVIQYESKPNVITKAIIMEIITCVTETRIGTTTGITYKVMIPGGIQFYLTDKDIKDDNSNK